MDTIHQDNRTHRCAQGPEPKEIKSKSVDDDRPANRTSQTSVAQPFLLCGKRLIANYLLTTELQPHEFVGLRI